MIQNDWKRMIRLVTRERCGVMVVTNADNIREIGPRTADKSGKTYAVVKVDGMETDIVTLVSHKSYSLEKELANAGVNLVKIQTPEGEKMVRKEKPKARKARPAALES